MALEETLEERQYTHGPFEVEAFLSQRLKRHFYESIGYKRLDHVEREALDMICCKLSRILCGDHTWPDHWWDIAGYSSLVAAHMESKKVEQEERNKERLDTGDSRAEA